LPHSPSFTLFPYTTLFRSGIADLAKWFSRSRTHNIVLLLDVCHSGGAGVALQRFNLNLDTGPNYFILGAARQDQIASQSSRLRRSEEHTSELQSPCNLVCR